MRATLGSTKCVQKISIFEPQAAKVIHGNRGFRKGYAQLPDRGVVHTPGVSEEL